MRSVILLILYLVTGSEVFSHRKCKDTWVDYTCSPSKNGKYKITGCADRPNTSKRTLKVKQVKHEDSWKCNSQLNSADTEELQFEVYDDHVLKESNRAVSGADPCPRPSVQTAYRSAETTLTCDPGDKHKSTAGFFCKDDNFICENILSGNSVLKSNRKFKNTTSGFMVSISNVSRQDAGSYWCGVKRKDKKLSVVLRKIKLEVKDITKFIRTAAVGQNVTFWCCYKGVDASYATKFICKGEDPSTCHRVISTKKPDVKGKFSMSDDSRQRNISITVREVTPDDGGTYWCGAESEDKQRKTFIHKLSLTVVSKSPVSPNQTTTTSAGSHVLPATPPPPPPPPPTTISAKSHSGPVVGAVIVCVAVLLLLFVVLICVYKRVSRSKNKGNAAAQQANEYCIYEDIQEGLQQSHNGINTIYVTVNRPTSDSAGLHYSTIQFKGSADTAPGKIPKQSSSACQYSALKYSKSPTSSPVNQPSTSEAEPLYSTVKKPQQR